MIFVENMIQDSTVGDPPNPHPQPLTMNPQSTRVDKLLYIWLYSVGVVCTKVSSSASHKNREMRQVHTAKHCQRPHHAPSQQQETSCSSPCARTKRPEIEYMVGGAFT